MLIEINDYLAAVLCAMVSLCLLSVNTSITGFFHKWLYCYYNGPVSSDNTTTRHLSSFDTISLNVQGDPSETDDETSENSNESEGSGEFTESEDNAENNESGEQNCENDNTEPTLCPDCAQTRD